MHTERGPCLFQGATLLLRGPDPFHKGLGSIKGSDLSLRGLGLYLEGLDYLSSKGFNFGHKYEPFIAGLKPKYTFHAKKAPVVLFVEKR